MILKICPYCQTENPENAVFCKRCGALFRGEPELKDTVIEKNKKKNKMILVACIILLVAGLLMIMRNSATKNETPTVNVADTSTTAPSTTVADTTTNTTTVAATTTTNVTTTQAPNVNATTAPTTNAASEMSVDEICNEYNSAIEKVKSSLDNITVHKTEKIDLEITHFSLPFPMDTINSFMKKLIPETDVTYNFSNGTAKEDKSVQIIGFIPPANGFPAVTADDLLSAEKSTDGTIMLKFKADSSSFANGQTVFPQYVDSATDVLDFATFSLGPVKIVSAEIQYPATEIKAELDGEGQLKKLTIIQPVSCTSTGGVGSLTADVGMNLKATTTYEVK